MIESLMVSVSGLLRMFFGTLNEQARWARNATAEACHGPVRVLVCRGSSPAALFQLSFMWTLHALFRDGDVINFDVQCARPAGSRRSPTSISAASTTVASDSPLGSGMLVKDG